MKRGACGFQGRKIQVIRQFDQEMVWVAAKEREVSLITQPKEQLREIDFDDSQCKIGYNCHGGPWCAKGCWGVPQSLHILRPLSSPGSIGLLSSATLSSWAFAESVYDAFAQLPVELYPDSLPTLNILREEGITLGIVSSIGTLAKGTIQKKVEPWIPAHPVLISGELGVHKPATTIFLRAAKRLHQPPRNCLFVGDDLQIDSIGSVQNGGYAVGLWLDREKAHEDQKLPKGVHRITALHEVVRSV